MKLIRYAIGLFLLAGCSDFLEERSQSEVHPESISDMEKILLGEGYFTASEGSIFNVGTDYMTDNYRCADEDSRFIEVKENYRWYFTWDPLMFDDAGPGEDTRFWYVPFQRIKGCNVVLDYLDQMKEGKPEKREYLRGEASALRGFYYLQLVNFFAMPYNEGNVDKNLAVPLKLSSDVMDDGLARNTVEEVYEQIEKDLKNGLTWMEGSGYKLSDDKRLRPRSVRALLSRMYLYQEKWEEVVKYADEALMEQSKLLHLTDSAAFVYDTLEMLWHCPVEKLGSNIYIMPFIVSDEFVGLYAEGAMESDATMVYDIRGDYMGERANAYIEQGRSSEQEEEQLDPWPAHFRKTGIRESGGGIRVAEVYLNRAEAYIRQYVANGDAQKGQLGLDDLNALREVRFYGNYVDLDLGNFAGAQALLDFCLRERRRELCGECNHRWFDLRRLGMPRIEHKFFNKGESDNAQVFILEKGDPRYVLPIPEKVWENNPDL